MKKAFKYIGFSILIIVILFILINQLTGLSDSTLKSDAEEIENLLNSKDSYVCILKTKKKIYKIGEKPELYIEIKNNTDSTTLMVGSLDGSDLGMRLPTCLFYVGHQIFGNLNRMRNIDININNFRELDFINLQPNSGFDPYGKGFFSSYQVEENQFLIPGVYNIRFFYSTINDEYIIINNKSLLQISQSKKEWYFKKGREKDYYKELKHLNKLDSLWNLVPKIELKSNTITIKYKI